MKFLSKYFNSDFYFSSALKIVGFHIDKNSSNSSCFKVDMLLALMWTLTNCIVKYASR